MVRQTAMAIRPMHALPLRPGRSASKNSTSSTAIMRIREFLRSITLKVRNRILPRAVKTVTADNAWEVPTTRVSSGEVVSTEYAGIQSANSFNRRNSPTESIAKEGISP